MKSSVHTLVRNPSPVRCPKKTTYTLSTTSGVGEPFNASAQGVASASMAVGNLQQLLVAAEPDQALSELLD